VTTKNGKLSALVLLVFGSFPIGCERSTQVRVEGGTAAVFVLSGTGRLGNFSVYSQEGREKADSPFDDSLALWEIKPIAGDLHGIPVEELDRITYGVVPPGYVQVRPPRGSPVPLSEGQKYFYEAVTTGAPWASGYIEIKNSRAVPTQGRGPCFGLKDEKWIRVPCPQ
jgi:hypothetical protein